MSLGLDPDQFRYYVIDPTLVEMGMYSRSASNLLLGTAVVESRLRYLKQLGSGPAVGLYQIEPATALDIVLRYFKLNPDVEKRIEAAVYLLSSADIDWDTVSLQNIKYRLISDLRLATALARVRYWMVPEKLPDPDDVFGLASYWKIYYNSHLGAGTIEKFVFLYRKYLI